MSAQSYLLALQDFRKARRRAALERILARLTRRPADLLSYEEVTRQLKARGWRPRRLEDIPLDAIVGSVGRYDDFTRTFLPKADSDADRWARVKQAVDSMVGVPPIEVYKVGEAYFVLDGNHRVSVARQLGATHIQAYVREVQTRVPLSPDDDPDDLIIKAEYADFLERTRLDELRPGADLTVTVPGQYRVLLEHIDVHRYFMGIDFQREIPYEEAVAHWYDAVYMPVVQAIREQSILRDFPGRTETDLYLWLSQHRAELQERLGIDVEPAEAAVNLAARRSPRAQRVIARVGEKLKDALVPEELEDGPKPGQWRRQRLRGRSVDRLFADILVPVSGEAIGWNALEQALVVARREQARLYGLHVVPTQEQQESPPTQAVRAEFERRCAAAGIPGRLTLAVGEVTDEICLRARWTDLMVVNLAHPPGSQPLARLASGFRGLLRRCAGPILAAPGVTSQLGRALLAYDGSPKAREALFVATYLAGRWSIPLAVVTVLDDGDVNRSTLEEATAYLMKHGVQATALLKTGPAAQAVLAAAQEEDSDLIIMGSYGRNPLLEVVLGSAVDEVLRRSRQPVLICR